MRHSMTRDMRERGCGFNKDQSTVFLSEEVEVTLCGTQRIRLDLKAGAGLVGTTVMVFDERDGELLM